jgi:hypothetical protein
MMKDEDLKEKISLWNTTECSRAYQKWVVSARCSVFSHSIPLIFVNRAHCTKQLFIFSFFFNSFALYIFFFPSMYLQTLLQTSLHSRLCCLSTSHHLLSGLSYLSLCIIQFYFSLRLVSWRGLYKRLYKLNIQSDFLKNFHFFPNRC